MESKKDYFKEMITDEDQKKASLVLMGAKMDCMMWEVEDTYKNSLANDNFSLEESKQMIEHWGVKKKEEGEIFGIDPDNTPAAHLERWTKEYAEEIQ